LVWTEAHTQCKQLITFAEYGTGELRFGVKNQLCWLMSRAYISVTDSPYTKDIDEITLNDPS